MTREIVGSIVVSALVAFVRMYAGTSCIVVYTAVRVPTWTPIYNVTAVAERDE